MSGASGYRVKYATNSSMTGATNVSFRYSSGNVRNLAARHPVLVPGRGRLQLRRRAGAERLHARAVPERLDQGGHATAPVPGPYDLDVASFNISVILGDSSTTHEPWSARRARVAGSSSDTRRSTSPAPRPT